MVAVCLQDIGNFHAKKDDLPPQVPYKAGCLPFHPFVLLAERSGVRPWAMKLIGQA